MIQSLFLIETLIFFYKQMNTFKRNVWIFPILQMNLVFVIVMDEKVNKMMYFKEKYHVLAQLDITNYHITTSTMGSW